MKVGKLEVEILKHASQTNSLFELFDLSSGSKQQTNLAILRILNQQHHLNTARNEPENRPLLKFLSAA